MPAPPAVVSGMAKQYAVPPVQYQVPKVMAMPQMAPVTVTPTAYGKAPQMAPVTYQARPVMVKNPDGSITQHYMPPQYQAIPQAVAPKHPGAVAPSSAPSAPAAVTVPATSAPVVQTQAKATSVPAVAAPATTPAAAQVAAAPTLPLGVPAAVPTAAAKVPVAPVAQDDAKKQEKELA